MRQTIFGLAVAAALTMTAGVAPAMACGGGLFQSSCSPCGYVDPCAAPVYVAPVYVAPVYSGCNTGCGGWGQAALYGAGSWAPDAAYEAEALPAYGGYGGYGYSGYGYPRGIGYGYGVRPGLRYGARFGYGGRYGGGRFGRY
jgi:hypothetical protein